MKKRARVPFKFVRARRPGRAGGGRQQQPAILRFCHCPVCFIVALLCVMLRCVMVQYWYGAAVLVAAAVTVWRWRAMLINGVEHIINRCVVRVLPAGGGGPLVLCRFTVR